MLPVVLRVARHKPLAPCNLAPLRPLLITSSVLRVTRGTSVSPACDSPPFITSSVLRVTRGTSVSPACDSPPFSSCVSRVVQAIRPTRVRPVLAPHQEECRHRHSSTLLRRHRRESDQSLAPSSIVSTNATLLFARRDSGYTKPDAILRTRVASVLPTSDRRSRLLELLFPYQPHLCRHRHDQHQAQRAYSLCLFASSSLPSLSLSDS